MGMYEVPEPLPSARDLNHGDIVAGAIRVSLPGTGNIALLKGPKLYLKLPGGTFAAELPIQLRAFCRLERVPFSIVLSNSCDNAQGACLELAPIVSFQFQGDPQTLTDVERWKQISAAATGTARPKRFYLPDNPTIAMPRSEVMLAERFLLKQELFDLWMREAGTKRVAALTPEACRHLQWAYNLMNSRNPRDDEAWPSGDDLKLKLAYLDAKIPTSPKEERALLEDQRAGVRKKLGVSPEAPSQPNQPGGAAPTPETSAGTPSARA